MNEIFVSINCITYNHERYIADAIESFLMQKTNFKYEILIHDDASTDSTANIIRKYENQYPDLIKPIYQKENQYSKGVKGIDNKFNTYRAKGKYIAMCEGDDYWTDPYKLQKQVDYMESNPKCSMCFHAAKFVNVNKKPTGKIARISNIDEIVSIEDILRKSTPDYISTASRVYRKELMINPPEWFYECSVGDLPQSLLLASKGYFYYMDEMMSAYRVGVPGSWTSRTIKGKNSFKENIKVVKEGINILKHFNEYTYGKYVKQVEQVILEKEFSILRFQHNLKELKKGKYKSYYQSLSAMDRNKIIFNCYFPNIYSYLGKLKNYK